MATEMVETTVYISSPMDFKTRFKNWWKKLKLKAALQHIGLLITLMGYTVAGGLVFRRFEYPAEISRLKYFNKTLILGRENLIQQIVNNTDSKNLDFISNKLEDYEKILQDAFSAGIPLFPQEQLVKWTTLKAVFFSSTVLTTIASVAMKIDLNKGLSVNLLLFKFMGHWPIGNKFLYNIYKWFLIISMYVYNVTGLIYLFKNLDDAEEISSTVYTLLSCLAVILKIGIFDKNWEDVKTIVETFQIEEFQPRNEEQLKSLKSGIFLAKLAFYYFFIAGDCCMITWVLFPIIDKERRLPSKAWFPFDYLSPQFYTITYIWQSILVCYLVLTNVSMDTLFAMLMVQIGAQCDVLNNEVSNLGFNNSEDVQTLHEDLKRCVRHHKLILELARTMGLAFGNMVFVQFATSVMVLCETMFMLSLVNMFSGTFLMLIVYQVAIFSQLFLYCWFGNEVILKSEKLQFSIYVSNWYNCPQTFKKDLLFFMHRAQKPIILYVGDLFPISVLTFTGILRSSWAYFMALRNTHDKSE